MDRYSTIGARPSGLDFKRPIITFLRTMTDLISIKKNICIIEYFSLRKYVLSVVMLLSNNSTEGYLLFLSVLDCWPWCSIPLQVGAIFDANHLLTEWESRQSVLVNPSIFNASASNSVKTKSSFLNRSGKFWFQSQTRRTSKDWHNTTRGPILIKTTNIFNLKWTYLILRRIVADWTS